VRETDFDTEHYLAVAKVRERQRSHRFFTERSNLKKVNEVTDKEQYWVEISNFVGSQLWKILTLRY
jgi:hypothetical protein